MLMGGGGGEYKKYVRDKIIAETIKTACFVLYEISRYFVTASKCDTARTMRFEINNGHGNRWRVWLSR